MPADSPQLRSVVASLIGTTPAQLTAETPLSALGDSLGAMKLKIALRRIGLTLAANFAPATFGQLERMLGNGEAPVAAVAAPPPTPLPPASETAGVESVGLDLQQ